VAGGAGGRWAGMDPRNRRALAIGAVAVVVLIAFLGVKLAGGGGGGAPAAAPSSPATTLAPGIPGGLPPTTTVTGTGTTPSTFEVFSSKDPFQSPLGSATTTPGAGSVGTSGPGGTGSGPGASGPTATTAGSGPGPVGTSGASAAGGTTGGSTAPSRGQQVELLDVYASSGKDFASIQVNDTVYSASTGQTFDTDYRVVDLSLATGCGDFAFQSRGFHLCKGQQILK